MEGLRVLMLKLDGHDSLCGSGCQSVIPYVHKNNCCTIVCVL
jgi:hypothetical protein